MSVWMQAVKTETKKTKNKTKQNKNKNKKPKQTNKKQTRQVDRQRDGHVVRLTNT